MSDWTTIDLVEQRNWDPVFLMLDQFRWPAEWPTEPLDSLAITLKPKVDAQAGTPVITLAGFDRVTGALKSRSRKYQGPAYQVDDREEGLRVGDVLVPPSDGPVLFVSPHLLGSLVSARYLAIRPMRVPGIWIWAVLNSQSGRSLRRRLTGYQHGTAAVRVALRSIEIPLPPNDRIVHTLPLLEGLEHATRGKEEAGRGSWWTTVDLTQVPWFLALGTPHPERLTSGDSLDTYCDSIVRGVSIDRNAATEPGPDLLPVASGRVLAGKPIRNYVPADSARVIAEPGDVLVGVIGERANARVVDQPMVVASTVYLLRPKARDLGPRLVRFLNGTEGLARRRLASHSVFIPQINVSDLRRMRVPVGALEEEGTPLDAGPLDQQLEELLWPS